MATGHTEFGLMFLSCAQETIEKGLGPTNCSEDAPTLPQGCNKVVHGCSSYLRNSTSYLRNSINSIATQTVKCKNS